MNWFAKMLFDGGSKSLKNQRKSICYSSNIPKNLKCFTKKLATFLAPRREEELSRGVVLIEFAFCMPILIILLFYINDLVRIKRYYSQTEFVGQQIANILQNISQNRTDKKIKSTDLKYAMALANQTMFPGKTMFKEGSGRPLVYTPWIFVYFIAQGNTNGTASEIWHKAMYSLHTQTPSGITCTTGYTDRTSVGHSKTNVDPSQIHPSLKIGQDPKIIIESAIYFDYGSGNPYDYTPSGQKVYAKQAMGLHLTKPKLRSYCFFNSVVIFTPKPGLFSETPPS